MKKKKSSSNLCRHSDLMILWVPGHSSIDGNEKVKNKHKKDWRDSTRFRQSLPFFLFYAGDTNICVA